MSASTSFLFQNIYDFAISIASSSYSPESGGILGYVIDNVKIINSSNERANSPPSTNTTNPKVKLDPTSVDIKKYILHDVLGSQGYPWAIAMGIIFLLLVVTMGVTFCLLQSKKRKSSKASLLLKAVSRQLHGSHKQMKKGEKFQIDRQFILRLAFVIPLFIVLALCVISLLVLLNNFNTTFSTSTTARPPSTLPLLVSAIQKVRHFLNEFGDAAIRDTAPVVDRMINATIQMQRESSTSFNQIMQQHLGGKRTMDLGDRMTRFMYTLVSNSTYLSGPASKEVLRVGNSLREPLQNIRDHFESLPVDQLPGYALSMKPFFTTLTYIDPTSPDCFTFQFASTVQYMLVTQENRTVDRILADGEYGKIKLQQKMAALEKKSSELMDIPGTVGNTTRATYIQMGEEFKNGSRELHLMELKLIENGGSVMNKLWLVLSFVLILCLLSILYILFLSIFMLFLPHFSPKIQNTFHQGKSLKQFQYATYFAFFMLAFMMLVISMSYISGSLLESQLCHFIRTTAYPSKNNPIDLKLNRFLKENWPLIKILAEKKDAKQKQPLPRVSHLLHAITQKCRNNEPILVAFNAIDTIDPQDLMKPEISDRFLQIGHKLMEEEMMSTDPNEMLAPGTLESLKKADSLSHFNENYGSMKQHIDSYALFGNISTGNNITEREIIEKVKNWMAYYSSDIPNLEDIRMFLKEVEKLRDIREGVLTRLENLSQMEQIIYVVQELQEAVPKLIATMSNKTSLLQLANQLFQEHIVKPTPEKSLGLMAEFAPQIMGRLGRCRPLYEAWDAATSSLCYSIDYPLNGIWLLCGISWLFSLLGLLLVALTTSSYDCEESDLANNKHLEGDSSEMVHLNAKESDVHHSVKV